MPETKSPSKLQYSRIIEIDRLLREKRRFALDGLAERFGVSRRTVERDIESLRDYFNAPIVFDRTAMSYKYSAENFSLPSISLSEKELFTILLAERALRQYKGTPFEPVIHGAFNKLVGLLPGGAGVSVDVADLCSAVVFEQAPPVSEYDPDIFAKLLEAVARSQTMNITYYSASRDRVTSRKVDPYHIANWGGDWYLIARCHKNRDIRNFHLTRVKEVHAKDHYFSRPDDFKPREYMGAGFGQMTGPKKSTVRVKLFPPASKWAKEKIWHPTQVLQEHRDGSLEITMQVSGLDAVRRWALHFGAQAEILEPKAMRDEVQAELKKAIKRYS